jgi:hypothetical protein
VLQTAAPAVLRSVASHAQPQPTPSTTAQRSPINNRGGAAPLTRKPRDPWPGPPAPPRTSTATISVSPPRPQPGPTSTSHLHASPMSTCTCKSTMEAPSTRATMVPCANRPRASCGSPKARAARGEPGTAVDSPVAELAVAGHLGAGGPQAGLVRPPAPGWHHDVLPTTSRLLQTAGRLGPVFAANSA